MMSDPSEKVNCPDCSMVVQKKNLSKHYRRMHPDLDPYKRLRESNGEIKLRKPRFEATNPWIAGVVVVLAVVTMMIVTSLLVYSFINSGTEGILDKRTVFFSASDGAIINASWYQASEAGVPTIYLTHDIGEDRTVWDDYAKELQSEGYNVMAIDTRGHGESTKNIMDQNIEYNYLTMGHDDFLLVSNDIQAAYDWVHGTDFEIEPNTNAGDDGAFIGVGKGGLYGMNRFSRMSRERIISGVIISPTLDCYGLNMEQVFQDWGDIRPIMMVASEGDGTGRLAIETIMETKDRDGETNGDGVFISGSRLGMDLLENVGLKERIITQFENSWDISPG